MWNKTGAQLIHLCLAQCLMGLSAGLKKTVKESKEKPYPF